MNGQENNQISLDGNRPLQEDSIITNNRGNPELPLVLTVTNLAQSLGVGRNTAYDLVRSGKVRSIRIGRQLRIPRDALLEFLSSPAN